MISESLPGFFGHRDSFAGLQTFHEFNFQPFLFLVLEVLVDETLNVAARGTEVRRAAALFHEFLELFGERDGHGGARHSVRQSRN